MDPVEVQLPIHDHPMTPLKDSRKGDCCGIKFEAISDGYSCSECDFFFHKRCSNPPEEINHSSHKCYQTNLSIQTQPKKTKGRCGLCREKFVRGIKLYTCSRCGLKIHLNCGKNPPPEVIDIPQHHDHKLELELVQSSFTCTACGKYGDGYSYKCHECHLAFHVSCEKYPAEVNHPSHSLHPLKLFFGEPRLIPMENVVCVEKILLKPFIIVPHVTLPWIHIVFLIHHRYILMT